MTAATAEGLRLWVGDHVYRLGPPVVFETFVATVDRHLEDGEAGSRFPSLAALADEGTLSCRRAAVASFEIDDIQRELGNIEASEIVWSGDEAPAPLDGLDPDAPSLAEAFRSADGQLLLRLLTEALNLANDRHVDLLLED